MAYIQSVSVFRQCCSSLSTSSRKCTPTSLYKYTSIPTHRIFHTLKSSPTQTSFLNSNRNHSLSRTYHTQTSTSSSTSMNIASFCWTQYNLSLVSYPLLTKACTSGSIMLLSDILAQKLSESSSKSIDWIRASKLALLGLIFLGPVGHFWYNFLDYLSKSVTIPVLVMKISADQLLLTPIVNACIFFYTEFVRSAFTKEANSLSIRISNGIKNVQQNLWNAMLCSWKLWPMIHIITFKFIPVSLRVLYVNIISLGWLTFMSLLANSNQNQSETISTKTTTISQ